MNVQQMIAMVQCYIHHKTGKEIQISQPKNPSHFFLLSKAYENCKGYFIKH